MANPNSNGQAGPEGHHKPQGQAPSPSEKLEFALSLVREVVAEELDNEEGIIISVWLCAHCDEVHHGAGVCSYNDATHAAALVLNAHEDREGGPDLDDE